MTESTTERRSSRSPTLVDNLIGRRIKQRRLEIHMSQSALAGLVGLTFQQVQKFELGINRVPASRLADIATALKASPADFFPPVGDPAPHLQRGDLEETLEAIARLIGRHKAVVDELQHLYRRLSILGMQESINGESEGR